MLHPEDSEWPQKFLKRFITYTVPHYYLNQFTRLKIKGIGKSIRLLHSEGVVSFVREKRIEQNGCVLKYKIIFACRKQCVPAPIWPIRKRGESRFGMQWAAQRAFTV